MRIVARRLERDNCKSVVTLSEPGSDAALPAAMALDDRRMLVTWSNARGAGSRIMARGWEEERWQEPLAVSPPEQNAFRSVIVVEPSGRTWIVWDAYQDGQYAVWARSWLPLPGPVESVSPQGENCLLPAALGGQSGLCAAWLRAQDAVDAAGAISQRYTLHAAQRDRESWKIVRDPQGTSVGAYLDHGLITKLEPRPMATGGYLGRRRQAMLLEQGDVPWLLWERKTDHEARTPDATGDLVGRPVCEGRWQEAVILCQGYVDYRLGDAARAHEGKFQFVASDLPRQYRRLYHRLVGDLYAGRSLTVEPWSGWHPTHLPVVDPSPPHEIRAGGKVYRLFWGDLHCHSHLSVDVEGEPDELLAYARDKSRLDVVVFTENDHMYNAWLTEAAFALGVYFAQRYTHPGRFVALPGYEWTSRLPRSPEVAVSDPRNWDPRYYGAVPGDWAKTATGLSYQNHRTVIYPPAGGPVVRHPEVENDIGQLLAAVGKAGGLAHPHHDLWKLSDSPLEANIEVTSGWGVFFRHPERIHEALQQGHRFGFVGNSDNHRRCPGLGGGLTGIYAESLTPEAILDALRHRRVFATTGSRIILDSRANGSMMGQETAAPASGVTLECSVIATRSIVEVTLVRDGHQLQTFRGDGTKERTFTYCDDNLAPGTHWYYWRVLQEGQSPDYPGNVKVAEGPLAWSSPHWVTVK